MIMDDTEKLGECEPCKHEARTGVGIWKCIDCGATGTEPAPPESVRHLQGYRLEDGETVAEARDKIANTAQPEGECVPHISPAYNNKGEILEDFALVHLKHLGYDLDKEGE